MGVPTTKPFQALEIMRTDSLKAKKAIARRGVQAFRAIASLLLPAEIGRLSRAKTQSDMDAVCYSIRLRWQSELRELENQRRVEVQRAVNQQAINGTCEAVVQVD